MNDGPDRIQNRTERTDNPIETWDDERLVETYRRLSRDLRLAGDTRAALYGRMLTVEAEMRDRGLDPSRIAQAVQRERDEYVE